MAGHHDVAGAVLDVVDEGLDGIAGVARIGSRFRLIRQAENSGNPFGGLGGPLSVAVQNTNRRSADRFQPRADPVGLLTAQNVVETLAVRGALARSVGGDREK